MHFAEAVAAFETQLQTNERSRRTVKSYRRDIGMLRRCLEREGHPLDVECITPTTLLQFTRGEDCLRFPVGTSGVESRLGRYRPQRKWGV